MPGWPGSADGRVARVGWAPGRPGRVGRRSSGRGPGGGAGARLPESAGLRLTGPLTLGDLDRLGASAGRVPERPVTRVGWVPRLTGAAGARMARVGWVSRLTGRLNARVAV